MSVGNVPLTIQIDKAPVTVITGTNGTGKSSGIIDAIFYALYGTAYRKLKKDQMVNTINAKKLEVELDFTIGKSKYKIIRGMRPNKFEIYVDGKLKPQPATMKDYQAWLEDSVLKMNAVTAKQIIFLGSTSFVPFMRLNTGDRRKVVEEILDIQIFSIMNTLLKGRAGVLSGKYEEIQQKLKLLANNIVLKEKHLTEMERQKEDHVADNLSRIECLQKDIDDLNNEIVTVRKAIEANLSKIEDAGVVRNNKSELGVLLSNMNKNRHRVEKDLQFFAENDNCPTCQQPIQPEKKENSISMNEDKIAHVMKAINLADQQMESFDKRLSEIAEIEQTIHQQEMSVSNNQTKVSTLQGSIERLREVVQKMELKEDDDSSTAVRKEIEEHEFDQQALRKEREDIADTSQYYKVVTSLLKDNGIKSNIINNYLPTINSLIRKYLEILEFPCEFTFDEEFNETMKSRYRDHFSYANFSEGQKMRIDLALLFSWRELARLRNSASCNLLVLDEIGSSSLDAEGTDAFMRIVEETSENNNIFIISHDTSISETDAFSRCLEYKLKDNFSILEENA